MSKQHELELFSFAGAAGTARSQTTNNLPSWAAAALAVGEKRKILLQYLLDGCVRQWDFRR
jgi:hypothetical protein